MIEDNKEHGDRAEEDGEGVELVVGYHVGRTTRERKAGDENDTATVCGL